jgi:hypothetical protein
MPISISMIVLGSQLVVPVADGVPRFDIARSCKLDVAATAGLSVDQSVKSCVNDEQKAKRQLASQWSNFPRQAGQVAPRKRALAARCRRSRVPRHHRGGAAAGIVVQGPVEGMNPKCPICRGIRWVYENHPDKPWDAKLGCLCGVDEPDVSQVINEDPPKPPLANPSRMPVVSVAAEARRRASPPHRFSWDPRQQRSSPSASTWSTRRSAPRNLAHRQRFAPRSSGVCTQDTSDDRAANSYT